LPGQPELLPELDELVVPLEVEELVVPLEVEELVVPLEVDELVSPLEELVVPLEVDELEVVPEVLPDEVLELDEPPEEVDVLPTDATAGPPRPLRTSCCCVPI
jgi:hypothetical protein